MKAIIQKEKEWNMGNLHPKIFHLSTQLKEDLHTLTEQDLFDWYVYMKISSAYV